MLIEAAITDDPLLLTHKAVGVQFTELIKRPLEKAGAPYPRMPSVVILDGLDECGDNAAVRQLLVAITDNVAIAGPLSDLRFLITSRPEFPIEAFFRTIPQLHHQLHLGLSEEANNDVHQFLLHGFSRIRTMHSDLFSPSVSWPSDHDIKLLVSRASGHFIYASTVLEFIDYDGDHPRNSLDFVLRHAPLRSGRPSAYAELDELYLTILRRVVVYEHHNLVRLLAVTLHGLFDICTIAVMLNIALEEVQLMLRGLRSLVGPYDTSVPHALHFLHASLHDFLVDPARSQQFFIAEHIHGVTFRNTILACQYGFP
jgi:hypothetical protein